ncbi:hydrogenase maturation protease [Thiorhodococcus minor]|uniref:Hydrogenase maturation protease n=1 Tax=Thiorhodococcus minor TaxID=57489 RepID=A0A6M0JYF0_9GAMM|nr:hydrogenase maturation protease [Thiorhodococcus minor]
MSRPSEGVADALVIGWGNLLLSDEGVGVHALRRLELDYRFEPAVRLEDGGTSGLDLLPLFADHGRILMLDAVAGELPPGEIQVIRDDEIRRVLSQKLSVHHLGVTDVLAVAELLEYTLEEIVLVGIVPERLEPGLELSPTLTSRLADFTETAVSILGGWAIRGREARVVDGSVRSDASSSASEALASWR